MAGKILGCGIPSVYITTVGGGTRLAEVKAKNVTWGRSLDEISQARVVAAAGQDAECTAVLNELDGFRYEMNVYRDATEEWVGPVTEPSYTRDETTIEARDLFQWFERRILPVDRSFVDTDLSIIAAQYMVDALAIDESPNISFTVNPCGVMGTRQVLGITYRRCADEVRELARGGFDFTAVGRRILCGGKEVSSPRLPTLTEDVFEIQNFRKAGLQMANDVYVLGAVPSGVQTPLVGHAGGPPDFPVVQITVQEPSILDIPSANAAAETRLEFWRSAPEYITGRFYETVPVGIEDLVPGVITRIRQQVGFRYVDADYRLMQMQVSVDVGNDGVKETVGAVWQPLGSTDATG